MTASDEVVDAVAWAIHSTCWGTGKSLAALPERVREDRRAEARAALHAAGVVLRRRRGDREERSARAEALKALTDAACAYARPT